MEMKVLVKNLEGIANTAGASLFYPDSLLPAEIALNERSDFNRGMLAVVLHVYKLVCQSAQGRQALVDLDFKPLFEYVESPTGGRCDD